MKPRGARPQAVSDASAEAPPNPRTALLDALTAGLAARRQAGLLRVPRDSRGTDLTSNDYLGLARDESLAAAIAHGVERSGAGTGGSRLLAGESPLPRVAEGILAAFCGQPSAVLFSSGYAANLGLLSALLGPGDHVLSDNLNHASLIDGMRLSGATKHIFAHADIAALEALLDELPDDGGRRIVVVESLYSMDGDLTDLVAVCAVAERYGAAVIVDEAHATGMYGSRGSGRVEALGLSSRVLCSVHTGGKALGSGGAWVAGPRPLARHLHNHARSYIYSTAPVPALVLSLVEAVRRLPGYLDRVRAAHRKAGMLRDGLTALGYDIGRSESCIVPVIIGTSERALSLAARLSNEGFDVRAIRPPTVPDDTARVRLTVSAMLPDDEIARLLGVMAAFQKVAA